MKKVKTLGLVFGLAFAALTANVAKADSFANGGGFHPPHHHPYPHYNRLACSAKNLRGQVFTAVGFDRGNVQRRAVEECYRAGSRQCHAAGCNVIY